MLHPGLYEQVINNALTGDLAEIPEARKSVAPIDKAEASKVLAQYLADVVQAIKQRNLPSPLQAIRFHDHAQGDWHRDRT